MLKIPAINKVVCTGCGACIDECPTDVMGLVENKAVLVKPEGCTYCGMCEPVCPVEAVRCDYEIVPPRIA